MPEEIDLSPEEEEALESVWAERDKQARLEEQGLGPPRWGLDRARHEQPTICPADLHEWVRVANAEYRRLRMDKVLAPAAERLSLQAANATFPASARS